MSLGLGVLFCFVIIMMIGGWSVVYYLLRKDKQTHFVGVSSSRSSLNAWSADDFLACMALLPAHVMIVSTMGEVLRVSPQTRRQFGDRLGAMLRHPTVHSLLDAALHTQNDEETGEHPVCSASITFDVPVIWTVHLAVRWVKLPIVKESYLVVVLSDRSEAQAVDRMRVDFVSHASHELRTPLASLSGFIDMLRHDDACEAQHSRSLSIMAHQADRMRRLIDRLLYLSRVQVRAHERPSHHVYVDDVMALVVGEVASQFDGRKAILTLDVDENLMIQADEDEMIQVFLNLIDNALKYGQSAGKTLEIVLFGRAVRENDPLWPGGHGLVLGVRDNGCGIDAHHLPRLTERFYRIGSTQDESVAGTGLGLSIVKHIIERHRGRFRIQSHRGSGTVASVWLPSVPASLLSK